jgi:hypothetical protein
MNFREPYMFLMALIYWLYREKDCSKLFEAWIPLSYMVAMSRIIFNWGAIISKQLSIHIEEVENSKTREILAFFFMDSYLLDAICARNVFLGLNLSCHIYEFLVHVYFSVLWENKYKILITAICDTFIAQIHSLIFKQDNPSLSEATRRVIYKIRHWYLEETRTYIRVFGATRAPHLLPSHVLDRSVLGEIFYQTILQDFSASLVKNKKRVFIPYVFYVGCHFVKDTTQAMQETQNQIKNRFFTEKYMKHEPNKLVD